MPLPCKAKPQRDGSIRCDRCALQWEVNDPDPPPCARNEITPQAAEILRSLDDESTAPGA